MNLDIEFIKYFKNSMVLTIFNYKNINKIEHKNNTTINFLN